MKRKEKGITLIALVITIIVLLILAGVTVAMLTGENGILRKATKAKKETEKAEVKELASLAYTEAMMDESATEDTVMAKVVEKLKDEGYEIEEVTTETMEITGINLSRETVNMETNSNPVEVNITLQTSSGSNSKKYVKIEEKYYELTIGVNGIKIAEEDTDITPDTSKPEQNLITTSVDKENVVDVSVEKILETSYKLKITPEGEGTAVITITVEGTEISKKINVSIKEGLLARDLIEEDIGDIVINYKPTADTQTEWRIFFVDNEHIYLIAKDYIPREKLPATSLGNKPNDGKLPRAAHLTAVKDDYKDTWASMIKWNRLKNTLSRYHKWENIEENQSKNHDGIKAVAYMLDEEIWTEAYGTEDAEYVIGGPTIEMFCESYNKRHPEKQIKYDENNNFGYRIKWQNDEIYEDNISGLNTTEFSNLYVITPDTNASAYFLGSTSDGSNGGVMYVDYNGNIGCGNYYDYSAGFRPLVCLKSTTQLRKVSDGYEIVK